MPLVFAIVPRPCRSVFVAFCTMSNAILELGCRVAWGLLIRHGLSKLRARLLQGCSNGFAGALDKNPEGEWGSRT
jgi:hypothetical protein